MPYNINNTNVINELTALTGDREVAINIFEQATHIYNTMKEEVFHVRLVDKQWRLVVDDICTKMDKHLLNEKDYDNL